MTFSGIRILKLINEISKKANQKLYILRLLKRFGFNDSVLVCLQMLYVRPVVESDVAWSSSITAVQRKILEHLQKRACRTILRQRFTNDMWMLWRPVGLSLLLIGGKIESHCRGFALGFAQGLANSERHSTMI